MRLVLASLVSFLLCAYPVIAQNRSAEISANDLKVAQIVESALASSGGRAAVNSVHDFRETGTISYNWGIEPLQGSATINAIADSDFRFAFNVPGHDRAWYITDGQGKARENGRTTALPFHSGANRGSLTLPILRLASSANSSKFRISYIERVTREGRDVYHVRAEKTSLPRDADKSIAQLETTEYFIDCKSFLIVRVEDVMHPPENMEVSQFHAIDYSDFRDVDGVQVPFSVVEHIGNAQTWSLELTEVSLNSGLTRSDIEF